MSKLFGGRGRPSQTRASKRQACLPNAPSHRRKVEQLRSAGDRREQRPRDLIILRLPDRQLRSERSVRARPPLPSGVGWFVDRPVRERRRSQRVPNPRRAEAAPTGTGPIRRRQAETAARPDEIAKRLIATGLAPTARSLAEEDRAGNRGGSKVRPDPCRMILGRPFRPSSFRECQRLSSSGRKFSGECSRCAMRRQLALLTSPRVVRKNCMRWPDGARAKNRNTPR